MWEVNAKPATCGFSRDAPPDPVAKQKMAINQKPGKDMDIAITTDCDICE
jgi:hypothetical protein